DVETGGLTFMPIPSHPLLRLVEGNKLSADAFRTALSWAASRHGINPRWHHRRGLSDKTGFGFRSPAGCGVARQRATKALGAPLVTILDRAVFEGNIGQNIDVLTQTITRLWRVWCEHGATRALST